MPVPGINDVNLFTWQYFVNYNMADGWYLVSAPIITANWEADSGDEWTIPFGGGIGKIFRIGKQPMNFQTQAFYNVEKPDNGADWQLSSEYQIDILMCTKFELLGNFAIFCENGQTGYRLAEQIYNKKRNLWF